MRPPENFQLQILVLSMVLLVWVKGVSCLEG